MRQGDRKGSPLLYTDGSAWQTGYSIVGAGLAPALLGWLKSAPMGLTPALD
jgi:hypothetical protein